MSVFHKKNIIKSIVLASLSLSFTLVACFSDHSGAIRKEDIGVQGAVSGLSEQVEEFLKQNSDRININKSSLPNNISNYTEYVPSDCEQIDKSVISVEDNNPKIDIYVENTTGKSRAEIIDCGSRKFQNYIQNSTTINDLLNQISGVSGRGRVIRQVYSENQENIQVSLQEVGSAVSFAHSFVFRDNLDIRVEDNKYIISIDSRLEKSVQAHLLAHALSIIEIETNVDNINIVVEKANLYFSSIQNLYYSDNNSYFVLDYGLHSEEGRVAKETIVAFYFYSRFHAYSANQDLQQAGLTLDHDLSDEIVSNEIIRQLGRKNLFTDKEADLKLFVKNPFDRFIDIILH